MKNSIRDVKIGSVRQWNSDSNKILLEVEYQSTKDDIALDLYSLDEMRNRNTSLLLATNEVCVGGMTLKEVVKAIEAKQNMLNNFSDNQRLGKAFVWVSIAAWLKAEGWQMHWLYEDEKQERGWLWHENRKTLDYMPEVVEWMMTNDKFVPAPNKTEPVQDKQEYIRNSHISDNCRIAMDEKTSAETLFTLCVDKEDIVRFYVAAHKNTSLETLQKLGADKTVLVRNEAQDRMSERLTKKAKEKEDVLRKHVNDRYKMASDSNTSPEILEQLSNDSETLIRFSVAQNPNTSIETLQKLNFDIFGSVVEQVKKQIEARTKQPSLSGCEDEKNFVPTDKLPPFPDLPLGLYRHVKGGLYYVTNITRNCEDTSKFVVIYHGINNDYWSRDYDDFIGDYTQTETKVTKRFTKISESDIK